MKKYYTGVGSRECPKDICKLMEDIAFKLASKDYILRSRAAKLLHTRNVYQILGSSLKSPSQFLICWAKLDKHGNIKGGTATTWNLAQKYDVPCFNLINEEDKQRLIKFVGG